MVHQVIHLPPELGLYLSSLWIGKGEGLALHQSSIPLLHPELIFNFGEVFDIEGQRVYNAEREGYLVSLSDASFKPKP